MSFSISVLILIPSLLLGAYSFAQEERSPVVNDVVQFIEQNKSQLLDLPDFDSENLDIILTALENNTESVVSDEQALAVKATIERELKVGNRKDVLNGAIAARKFLAAGNGGFYRIDGKPPKGVKESYMSKGALFVWKQALGSMKKGDDINYHELPKLLTSQPNIGRRKIQLIHVALSKAHQSSNLMDEGKIISHVIKAPVDDGGDIDLNQYYLLQDAILTNKFLNKKFHRGVLINNFIDQEKVSENQMILIRTILQNDYKAQGSRIDKQIIDNILQSGKALEDSKKTQCIYSLMKKDYSLGNRKSNIDKNSWLQMVQGSVACPIKGSLPSMDEIHKELNLESGRLLEIEFGSAQKPSSNHSSDSRSGTSQQGGAR